MPYRVEAPSPVLRILTCLLSALELSGAAAVCFGLVWGAASGDETGLYVAAAGWALSLLSGAALRLKA